jgi:hypothetical protein
MHTRRRRRIPVDCAKVQMHSHVCAMVQCVEEEEEEEEDLFVFIL